MFKMLRANKNIGSVGKNVAIAIVRQMVFKIFFTYPIVKRSSASYAGRTTVTDIYKEEC